MRSLVFVSLAIVSLTAICACSGDEPPAAVNKCSGATYDVCTSEHDCTTFNCRPFGTFEACTQACSASAPCPKDENGDSATCANSICVPNVPNTCTL